MALPYEELAGLRDSLHDQPAMAYQVYNMLFLLHEIAARYDVDLNEQWSIGRVRKKEKNGAWRKATYLGASL